MNPQVTIKVGLVGESPFDTSAIRNLLSKQYGRRVQFIPLVERRHGSQLDNPKFGRLLQIDLQTKQPRIVLFIRDADCIKNEEGKMKKPRDWYQKLSKGLRQPHLLLLNVYELEALIFANIETFNRLYGTDIKADREVTMIKEPKEELMRSTPAPNRNKKFEESHCPQIFSELDLATVQNRCGYFKAFISELDVHIADA